MDVTQLVKRAVTLANQDEWQPLQDSDRPGYLNQVTNEVIYEQPPRQEGGKPRGYFSPDLKPGWLDDALARDKEVYQANDPWQRNQYEDQLEERRGWKGEREYRHTDPGRWRKLVAPADRPRYPYMDFRRIADEEAAALDRQQMSRASQLSGYSDAMKEKMDEYRADLSQSRPGVVDRYFNKAERSLAGAGPLAPPPAPPGTPPAPPPPDYGGSVVRGIRNLAGWNPGIAGLNWITRGLSTPEPPKNLPKPFVSPPLISNRPLPAQPPIVPPVPLPGGVKPPTPASDAPELPNDPAAQPTVKLGMVLPTEVGSMQLLIKRAIDIRNARPATPAAGGIKDRDDEYTDPDTGETHIMGSLPGGHKGFFEPRPPGTPEPLGPEPPKPGPTPLPGGMKPLAPPTHLKVGGLLELLTKTAAARTRRFA